MDGGLGLAQCLALLCLTQFTFDGGYQPGEIALHDVVVGAMSHGLDRNLLADGAGDNDDGDVVIGLTYQR